MTERGLSNDELERQLQEEEKGIEQQPTSEATIESSNEQLGKEIDLESAKTDASEKTLENNLVAVGGEEGLKKTWDSMDEDKKRQLSKELAIQTNNAIASKSGAKDGLMILGGGVLLSACGLGAFIQGGDERTLMEAVTFLAGGGLIAGMGTYVGIKEKVQNLISKHKANKAEKELSGLEQKYAA